MFAAHVFQHLSRHFPSFSPRQIRTAKGDIVEDPKMGEETIALRHVSDSTLFGGQIDPTPGIEDGEVTHLDPARIGAMSPDDGTKQGGLTRPIRAHQGHWTRIPLEIDV